MNELWSFAGVILLVISVALAAKIWLMAERNKILKEENVELVACLDYTVEALKGTLQIPEYGVRKEYIDIKVNKVAYTRKQLALKISKKLRNLNGCH